MKVRRAVIDDQEFLWWMLVKVLQLDGRAANHGEVETHAHVRHYVAGWPRAGDFGRIAVDGDGIPLGAVWARRVSARHPGYGFVAEEIPEICMAVVASHPSRGGIGTQLLRALIDAAREEGCCAVSLSVEDGNRATQLYRAAGFVMVGRVGNSDTMLLELRG